MTHPRVLMFLMERDRAHLRKDWGIVRSMTAELRRLGVPDAATWADPNGKQAANGHAPAPEAKKAGRPPKPRCEHGNVVERCDECQELEIEETLAAKR